MERKTAGYANALPNGSLHEPVSRWHRYETCNPIWSRHFSRSNISTIVCRVRPGTIPAPSEDTQPAITDQKLDQTAAAIKRVASVKQNYQQRIAAAPSSDTERIAEEWMQELAKAVT